MPMSQSVASRRARAAFFIMGEDDNVASPSASLTTTSLVDRASATPSLSASATASVTATAPGATTSINFEHIYAQAQIMAANTSQSLVRASTLAGLNFYCPKEVNQDASAVSLLDLDAPITPAARRVPIYDAKQSAASIALNRAILQRPRRAASFIISEDEDDNVDANANVHSDSDFNSISSANANDYSDDSDDSVSIRTPTTPQEHDLNVANANAEMARMNANRNPHFNVRNPSITVQEAIDLNQRYEDWFAPQGQEIRRQERVWLATLTPEEAQEVLGQAGWELRRAWPSSGLLNEYANLSGFAPGALEVLAGRVPEVAELLPEEPEEPQEELTREECLTLMLAASTELRNQIYADPSAYGQGRTAHTGSKTARLPRGQAVPVL